MNRMPRLFGKVLALFAVMASAINAQCVMSCLLQTAMTARVHGMTRDSASRTGHACCPRQRSSAPKQQEQPKQPCPNVAAMSGAVEVTPPQYWNTAQPTSLDHGIAMARLIPIRRVFLAERLGLSGLPNIALLSVLRV